MKLNSMDLIEIFSGELFFAEKENQVRIMDINKCGKVGYDYGVYIVVPKENILSGNMTLDYIPDMYIEGYMNFML